MNHIGLFEGIGGFSLGARWMGWTTIAWCEIDKFCQKVLKYHFPDAKGHEDIKETDFSIYRGQCDIVTGGFPCQPYSQAGKRKGKADDRHLWPQMLRAIREIQPRWVVGENVPGLLNWGRGMVLDEIKTDLEAAGFEVFPPLVLPACGKDAPHRRERLWIVAHSTRQRKRSGASEPGENDSGGQFMERSEQGSNGNDNGEGRTIANPLFINGKEIQTKERNAIIRQELISDSQAWGNRGWDSWPTQSPVCFGNDGLSSRLDGITFSKWRNESIKAGGNAIVPQIAYEIFKAIEQMNKELRMFNR